jgi:hypothetical protein
MFAAETTSFAAAFEPTTISTFTFPFVTALAANASTSPTFSAAKAPVAKADEQRERLAEEGVIVKNYRVNMAKFGWKPDLHTILVELEY